MLSFLIESDFLSNNIIVCHGCYTFSIERILRIQNDGRSLVKSQSHIQSLLVLVIFSFHFHSFDSIVRLIIDYDVFHVNAFVDEDQMPTRKTRFSLTHMDKSKTRLTKRLQSVQHLRVATGSSVAETAVVIVVDLLSSCGEV